MPELWDAFIQDYQNEIFNWSTRELLKIFWYYCQNGDKAVFKLLNERKIQKDKENERLRKENEWLLQNLASVHCQALRLYNDKAREERKKLIIKEMQQALKKREDKKK